ncbi:hypothetical protein [Methylobacterium frigidaeris]|uniref:Uncharacterized protein n=1 Tax=Methylobacterium frigidaeris TaxID=2038277 RepID=A0AA37H9M1_9HYPH|nr:hypothetical protein [Methylobacterium frigidaeris]PIK68934.1 hypothetical protein CS379_32395 [Methylobacterium frigidaeris]GJD61968.1 hypothetical protein MPEAHAMD_2117 [Methylobacterium frigidaeris]
MRWRALALVAAVLMTGAGPSRAMSLSESGDRVMLAGSIVPGDGEAFARFLAGPHAQPLRVVYLDSGGGKVLEGIAIGRAIRRAGLVTAVDAHAARCDSACTLIFAGGVRRYYVHGDDVYEGMSGRSGLGFHTAHRPGNRVEASTLNERGTDAMRRFYGEMGQPGAATLVDKAAFNTLYRPSGSTALSLGIATSLQAP